MKIIIFSTAFLSTIGGAEVAVEEITSRLPEIQFDMITTKMKKDLPYFQRVGNINIYRVGIGAPFDKLILPFWGWWKAWRLNKKNKYDLAWSIMASQASIAASFLKISNTGIKLLLNIQEGDEEEHLKRYVWGNDLLYKILIKPWHLLVFKKADHTTVISNYLKDRVVKNGAKGEIDIIPNGVDIKEYSNFKSKSGFSGLRKSLGFDENDKIIITVSRLVEKNGVGDLIKAMPYLSDMNCRLLVIGTGNEEQQMKKLTAELALENKVKFLGRIEHGEIPEYLHISDVFVRPSLSEGLGNVFLEAMAAGLPVIGTPVGGIPDFLFDGETGLFCQVKNPESIAEKIKIILSDGQLRDKLTDNGRRSAAEKYGWDKIAIDTKKVFEAMQNKY